MTWDGIVTKYHSQYLKEIDLNSTIEVYIQSRVIKKTLESISFEYRRGDDTLEEGYEGSEKAVERLME